MLLCYCAPPELQFHNAIFAIIVSFNYITKLFHGETVKLKTEMQSLRDYPLGLFFLERPMSSQETETD